MSTQQKIQKIILIFLIFHQSQQNQISCGFRIINSGITIGKLVQEFLTQSWRFEKQMIVRIVNDVKKTFKDCKGYIPDELEAGDCFDQMSHLAEELEIIYEKFDVELYEDGILQLVYNCPTVIKLYDYCLNSKLIKKIQFNQLKKKQFKMFNLDDDNFTPLSFKEKIQILLQMVQNLKIDTSLKDAYFQKLIFFSQNYKETQNLSQKPLETVGDQVLNLLYTFIETINDLEKGDKNSSFNTLHLNSFKSITSKIHTTSCSLQNQNSSNWSLSNLSQPVQVLKPKLKNNYQMNIQNYKEIPTDVKYNINKKHTSKKRHQSEVLTLDDLLRKIQHEKSEIKKREQLKQFLKENQILQTMGDKRADYLYMAKVCEQTERYDDMLEYIKKLMQNGNELDVEERNLLSVAYKNSVGSKRTSWRILDTLLNKDKEKKDPEVEKHRQLVKDFKKQVEKELDDICKEIIDTLDKKLIKDPKDIKDDEDVSPQVFYLKMKGDYYRYIAEYAAGGDREEVADKAYQAYQQAEKLATEKMDTTDPIRLGLALNFSVFHYEIRSDPKKACDLAKTAFDDAIADIENIQDTNYKDSTTIMQLMRDNLTLWTSELDENEDDNEDEDA